MNTWTATETGLSLGSNLGDRMANLVAAKQGIAALHGTRIVAVSPVYETEPVGVKDVHRHLKFLNAVVICETELDLPTWFDRIRELESVLGRVRSPDRYAPRIIDLDVLYFGEVHTTGLDLEIPHHAWKRRRFVLQPLADVRPEWIMPGETRSVKEILAELVDSAEVTLVSQEW